MPDLNPTDLVARAEEIYDYLASNDISQTLKRLLDFVQDFSNKEIHYQEAIALHQNYALYQKTLKANHLKESKAQRDALIQNLFDLIESIEKDWENPK